MIPDDMVRRAWVTCPDCRGYVMHTNGYGEVDDGCDYCHDRGEVRARDDKGRFTGNSKERRNG